MNFTPSEVHFTLGWDPKQSNKNGGLSRPYSGGGPKNNSIYKFTIKASSPMGGGILYVVGPNLKVVVSFIINNYNFII